MLDRKTHLDEMVKRMNALEEEVDQLKSELAKVHVLIKKKKIFPLLLSRQMANVSYPWAQLYKGWITLSNR